MTKDGTILPMMVELKMPMRRAAQSDTWGCKNLEYSTVCTSSKSISILFIVPSTTIIKDWKWICNMLHRIFHKIWFLNCHCSLHLKDNLIWLPAHQRAAGRRILPESCPVKQLKWKFPTNWWTWWKGCFDEVWKNWMKAKLPFCQ